MRFLLPVYVGLILAGLGGIAPSFAQSEPGAAQPTGPSVADIVIDEAARHILRNYYERNANAWVIAHPDDYLVQQANLAKSVPNDVWIRNGFYPLSDWEPAR